MNNLNKFIESIFLKYVHLVLPRHQFQVEQAPRCNHEESTAAWYDRQLEKWSKTRAYTYSHRELWALGTAKAFVEPVSATTNNRSWIFSTVMVGWFLLMSDFKRLLMYNCVTSTTFATLRTGPLGSFLYLSRNMSDLSPRPRWILVQLVVAKVRFTKYGEKMIRQKMGLNCRILAFTIDRWMQLDERHRLDIFSWASQTWPLFAFTGGICHYREGIFITGRG